MKSRSHCGASITENLDSPIIHTIKINRRTIGETNVIIRAINDCLNLHPLLDLSSRRPVKGISE
jgi:hypothetical protein